MVVNINHISAVDRNLKEIPSAGGCFKLIKFEFYGEGAIFCKNCNCTVFVAAIFRSIKICGNAVSVRNPTAVNELAVFKLNVGSYQVTLKVKTEYAITTPGLNGNLRSCGGENVINVYANLAVCNQGLITIGMEEDNVLPFIDYLKSCKVNSKREATVFCNLCLMEINRICRIPYFLC